jgi:hypothetical protein
MKKYNPDGKCIKCGSGEIEDEYHARLTRGKWINPPPEAFIPEHIARTCKHCGYQWKEAPLDWIDPEKAKAAQKAREKAGHVPSDTPIIEVRDVVKTSSKLCNIKGGCIVIAMDHKDAITYNEENGICSCRRPISILTLIRKGPKVHRFGTIALKDSNQAIFHIDLEPNFNIGISQGTYELTGILKEEDGTNVYNTDR